MIIQFDAVSARSNKAIASIRMDACVTNVKSFPEGDFYELRLTPRQANRVLMFEATHVGCDILLDDNLMWEIDALNRVHTWR